MPVRHGRGVGQRVSAPLVASNGAVFRFLLWPRQLVADVRLRRHGRPPMSVRLAMSEICRRWHAEVPDRVVAADTLVAGDSEEEDEEEEDDIEQDEEEDTEDDGYSE